MGENINSSNKQDRVKQFLNMLEKLPRLCSPTICGTLSQPTTRNERVSRGADLFEWSLEQKAILSPANITTDTDNTDEWQNVAELSMAWRQQESEKFFSQRTIAPSPLVPTTPIQRGRRRFLRPLATTYDDIMDEDEEDDKDDEDRYEPQLQMEQQQKHPQIQQNNIDQFNDEEFEMSSDNMRQSSILFSPQPLKNSQSQQTMDLFSPNSFCRVMEDESTLQSTPKSIGSSIQGTRSLSRPSGIFD